MNELAHQPGLDGRAFHLVNPTPQSNLDVMTALAAAAGAPQIRASIDNEMTDRVTDTFLSSVVSKVVGSAPGHAIAQATTGRLGVPPEVLSHLNLPTTFDATATTAALAESGIEVPPLEAYASALWDYWEQNLDPTIRAARATRAAVKGTNIVITGATSGIGKASALRLAALGANVILVARGVDALELSVNEIRSRGGSATAYPCDLADLDAIDTLVKQLSGDFDRIDFLVNNAGRSIRRSLRLSYDRFHDYERTMQLNYFGPLALILALLPAMRERGFGQIVNVSSIGVQTNTPRFSAYVASKAALDAFSRCIASEVVDDGVGLTTIHMPLVRTPMIAPTRIYDSFPAISPEEAADMLCEAIVHRPKRVATRLGNLGQVAYALSPKSMDAILNTAYKLFPDSAAARGGRRERALDRPAGEAPDRASRAGIAFARVTRGIHW
jgi:NAD(P)-dependent dehydrogenase (short-subunit alcohol dehydrogenase family)